MCIFFFLVHVICRWIYRAYYLLNRFIWGLFYAPHWHLWWFSYNILKPTNWLVKKNELRIHFPTTLQWSHPYETDPSAATHLVVVEHDELGAVIAELVWRGWGDVVGGGWRREVGAGLHRTLLVQVAWKRRWSNKSALLLVTQYANKSLRTI